MTNDETRDPVFQVIIDVRDQVGVARLGLMANQVWHDDPRRLSFMLARYKFVSKMLGGKSRVLEVGCGDAFGSRIVRQEVRDLIVTDYDAVMIQDAKDRMVDKWRFEPVVHDIVSSPITGTFDAAYGLDFFEHIPTELNDVVVENIKASLTDSGVLIFGIPSLESQAYASPPSKAGHVNCQRGPDFKRYMERHFDNVFMFSMNDEVVHTGFYPMAHYLLAVCCAPRRPASSDVTAAS